MADNVKKEFLRFKGMDVLICLKNNDEQEGKVISIDNYLNTVLETENGIRFIKGTRIAFISLKG